MKLSMMLAISMLVAVELPEEPAIDCRPSDEFVSLLSLCDKKLRVVVLLLLALFFLFFGFTCVYKQNG